MNKREAVEAWIFDNTGLIKPGNQSPGVQHPYTATAGKTTNFQIGVSLAIAARTRELPVATLPARQPDRRPLEGRARSASLQ
jgi:SRSO17 transposase